MIVITLEQQKLLLAAVCKDDSRYAIEGIFIKKVGDKLHLVATDTRRLVLVERSMDDIEPDIRFETGIIVRTDAFKRSCSKLTKDRIVINPAAWLPGDIIDGQYPRYLEVMPKDNLVPVMELYEHGVVEMLVSPIAFTVKYLADFVPASGIREFSSENGKPDTATIWKGGDVTLLLMPVTHKH